MTVIDDAERDGVLDVLVLAAKAAEFDLDDEELVALRGELLARGVELVSEDEDELDVGETAEDESDLNMEDERELRLEPEAVGVSDALTLFMNEIGKHELLTAAEEVELAKRIERGDGRAKERMINANLRLVVSIAKRYR